MPTFFIEGNGKIQAEISENEDVIFFLPSKYTTEFLILTPGLKPLY